jgi:hypothetical protein
MYTYIIYIIYVHLAGVVGKECPSVAVEKSPSDLIKGGCDQIGHLNRDWSLCFEWQSRITMGHMYIWAHGCAVGRTLFTLTRTLR